jgi:Bacterial Ig-like domain
MKNWKIMLLCLASAVSLVACPPTETPAKTPKLSITPGSATLTAGTGSAGFSATLTDGTAAIAWAISPEVGTLSAATGTSTTYSPPASVSSTTAVTLTASSSGATSVTATITVNPGATVDTTAPTVVSITPNDGATGVAKDSNIVVTFSEAMNQAATQTAFQSADLPAAVFTWNSPTELTVNPSTDLMYLATLFSGTTPKKYAFSLTNTATDLAGNKLSTTNSSFSTFKEVKSTISSTDALTGDVNGDGGVSASKVLFGPGDAADNSDFTSYISFDVSVLSSSILPSNIISANLGLNQVSVTGSPQSLKTCLSILCTSLLIESLNFGSSLTATAVNSIPFGLASFVSCSNLTINNDCALKDGKNTFNVSNTFKADWTNKTSRGSRSQYKLKYSRATNADNKSDFPNISGTGVNKPSLEIVYLFP